MFLYAAGVFAVLAVSWFVLSVIAYRKELYDVSGMMVMISSGCVSFAVILGVVWAVASFLA